MKYAWMATDSVVFALTEMCAVLDSRLSGYCAWKRGGTPDSKRLTDTQLVALKFLYNRSSAANNGMSFGWVRKSAKAARGTRCTACDSHPINAGLPPTRCAR